MTDAKVEEFLEHFGKKGMKWGIRKDKVVGNEMGRDVTKGDLKWKTKLNQPGSLVKLNNSMANTINAGLPGLNKKYANKDLGYDSSTGEYKSAAGKKYVKEYESLASGAAKDSAQSLFGNSPSGNWSTKASYSLQRGLQVEVSPSELKQSEINLTDDGLIFTCKVSVSPNGVFNPLYTMAQSAMSYEDIIEHYGVKGQKWGVRKKSKGRSDSTTKFKKPPKRLTEAELNRRIKRLESEKRYNELNSRRVGQGEKMATDIVRQIGTSTLLKVGTGVAVFAVKKGIEKKFGSDVANAILPKKK